jgi:deoxyribonuclease-4
MLCGAHVSAAGGIDTAIDRIEAIGGDCVQVFTQSPRMWKPTAHTPEAVERFRARRAEAGIGGVVCHAVYLVNLAAPDVEVYRKSVAALVATVDTAVALGADGVVFHVGSHLGAGLASGRRRIVSGMRKALARCEGDMWLLMENSAGAGGTIGRSLPELAGLVDALDGHPRLGICLDSCHLWASGYDVTKPAVVHEVVAEVDATIGLDRLRALHVNDSVPALGSNRDRHANLLEGEMGVGLAAFLGHPAFQGLAAYLEVPGANDDGPDADQIRKLRDLHRRGANAARRRRARATSGKERT